jgi:uncharacterized protein (DUF1697 family)
MNTYIALLRGINVSGQKTIRMTDLKQLVESMGFQQVVTYVQSGNVVFQAVDENPARLETAIRAEIQRVFGFEVAVLIRTAADLQRVAAANPFVQRPESPVGLYVTFLAQRPPQAVLNQLKVPLAELDEYVMGDQEIFLYCPGGYGRTKLSNTFFERKLKMPATTRNWKTVCTLLEMARGN